jgi:hypothetical protein
MISPNELYDPPSQVHAGRANTVFPWVAGLIGLACVLILATVIVRTWFHKDTQQDLPKPTTSNKEPSTATAFTAKLAFDSKTRWPVGFAISENYLPDATTRSFANGLTREYRADGSAKARGIKLRIAYPQAWRATEGVRPHILQKFSATDVRALESAMIVVKEIPAELQRSARDGDAELALQLATFECESAGYTLVDSGKVPLVGTVAGWTEYSARFDRLDVEVHLHGLLFFALFIEASW